MSHFAYLHKIFFYYFYLKEVKGNLLDEGVLRETRSCDAAEFVDVHVKPDRDGQVKCFASRTQAVEDLGRAAVCGRVLDYHIAQQMIIFYFFTPHSEHTLSI